MSKFHSFVKDVNSFFVEADNSFQTLEEHLLQFYPLFINVNLYIQYTLKLIWPNIFSITFLCLDQGLANYRPLAPFLVKLISELFFPHY